MTESVAVGGLDPAQLGLVHDVDVDPRTGSAAIHVELPLAGGRSGFAPALSLDYRSGGGNSPYGWGWALGGTTPVTVDTTGGVPRYDGRDDHSFGGTRLLPALERDGDGWRQRTRAAGDHAVQLFRLQDDTDAPRFERWVEREKGRAHWRMRDRRNVLTVLGLDAGGTTRLGDPDAPERVFAWLPEIAYDGFGNAMRYEHVPEDLSGVDLSAPYERSRVGRPCAQRYLKRIRYGNTVPMLPGEPEPAGNHWCFEVVLDYGDHATEQPVPAADRPWPARPDPFSACRAGFEVRTWRLLRRVLLFHDVPELGDGPTLVRTIELGHRADPAATVLVSLVATGHRRDDGTARSLPALAFGFTAAAVGSELHAVDDVELENAPYGFDGRHQQLVDLYGEGIPGILAEVSGAWYFKRGRGGGAFDPVERLPGRPAHPSRQYAVGDFDRDGNTDLVTLRGRLAGATTYERDTGTWTAFRPFAAAPQLDGAGPRSQWFDIDGDGRPDVAVAGTTTLTWYPSRGMDGFGSPRQAPRRPGDVDAAPMIDDPDVHLFLADMSGDGLADQVRVRNGSVEYWPALGNGAYGDRVVMDGAPVLAPDGAFDPAGLRLLDLDGTGTTDLLYVGQGELRWWINAGGNRFVEGGRVVGLPYLDQASSARVLDFLGDGVPCLVWSSPRPGSPARVAYLPLSAGAPPRLIASVTTSAGRETRLSWSSSARHFARDRDAGRPWPTPLPAHPWVVDAREIADLVGGTTTSERYAYHDGAFDGEERSFRGFAVVDRYDAVVAPGADDPRISCTRTWFHTGAPDWYRALGTAYARDPLLPVLPGVTVEDAGSLADDEHLDALRAVAGQAVREETYAVGADGTLAEHPFVVTQTRYVVRRAQPAAPGRSGEARRPAAFRRHVAERLTHEHEQVAGDPRVTHQLNLEVDVHGVVALACDVAYPRRPGAPDAIPAQAETLATAHRYRSVTIDGDDRFEVGVVVETEGFELAGLRALAPLPFAAALAEVTAAISAPVDPEQPLPAGGPASRRLSWSRSFFWADDGSGPLPLGTIGARTLLHHQEAAALTAALVADLFGGLVTPAMVTAAGYVERDGHLWAPEAVHHVAGADGFFLLDRTERWDGAQWRIEWDPYRLVVRAATDPIGNRTEGEIDYHLLEPWRVTDPNGAVVEVGYDALGVAVRTTTHGDVLAPDGSTKRYGHEPLSAQPAGADRSVAGALADPAATVGRLAQVVRYDLESWATDRTPPRIVTVTREELVHDGLGGGTPDGSVSVAVAHLDGLGRPVQSKVRVEGGPAVQRGADGQVVVDAGGEPVLAEAAERWLASGHIVLDAKQQPIRQFEPYFSTTPDYEGDPELERFGVAHVTTYDALGRPVRIDAPHGAHSRTELLPWKIVRYDENDTVQDSLYRVLREALPDDDPEKQALRKAQAHAGTPGIAHLDPLGREAQAVVTTAAGPSVRSTRFDANGDEAETTDPRRLVAVRNRRDLLGRTLWTAGIDAGEAWTWIDAAARHVTTWDGRGIGITTTYDALDRPLARTVTGDGPARVAEDVGYGDEPGTPDAALRHVRGRPVRTRDESGVVRILAYDPAGRPLRIERQLCADADAEPDWAGAVALAADVHRTETGYDAIGRPVRQARPDGTLRRLSYSRTGQLARVAVTMPGGDELVVLDGVTRNARGQRTGAVLGNGVAVAHELDRYSFATTRISATRPASAGAPARTLQDLRYTYDPAGNVTRKVDEAQQPDRPTPLLTGLTVSSHADFTYDAAYRLVEATGRVHQALLEHDYRAGAAGTFKGTRHLTLDNGAAVERYRRTYSYDPSGNLTRIVHQGASRSWTTDAWVSAASNRALPARDPSGVAVTDPESRFDAIGQCTSMPHLRSMQWGWRSALRRVVVVDRSATGEPDDDETYVHDAGGQRVRKLTRRLVGGTVETTEKLYLDGCEIKRVRAGDALVLERFTSDVGDEQGRIALIHRWTVDAHGRETDAAPVTRVRYQLTDHVGSAVLELDGDGGVIGYEELFPYGGSAFLAGDRQRDVGVKDYRYAGKERDDATGFYYYGYRYYSPYIGRWLSPDPAGSVDSLNLYEYALSNPITYTDPDGLQSQARGFVHDYSVSEVPPMFRAAFSQLSTEQRQAWARRELFLYDEGDRIVTLTRQQATERVATETGVGHDVNVYLAGAPTEEPARATVTVIAGGTAVDFEEGTAVTASRTLNLPDARGAGAGAGGRRPASGGGNRSGGAGRSGSSNGPGRTGTGPQSRPREQRAGSRPAGTATGTTGTAGTTAGPTGTPTGTTSDPAPSGSSPPPAQSPPGPGSDAEAGDRPPTGPGSGGGDAGSDRGAGEKGRGPGGGGRDPGRQQGTHGNGPAPPRAPGSGNGTGRSATGSSGGGSGDSPGGSNRGAPGGTGDSPGGVPGGVVGGADQGQPGQGQPGAGPPGLGGDVNGTPDGARLGNGTNPGGRGTGPGNTPGAGAGSSARSGPAGSAGSGSGGTGRGGQTTMLDRITRYVGYLNFSFTPDKDGQSGGIPGSLGLLGWRGPLVQVLYGLVTLVNTVLMVSSIVKSVSLAAVRQSFAGFLRFVRNPLPLLRGLAGEVGTALQWTARSLRGGTGAVKPWTLIARLVRDPRRWGSVLSSRAGSFWYRLRTFGGNNVFHGSNSLYTAEHIFAQSWPDKFPRLLGWMRPYVNGYWNTWFQVPRALNSSMGNRVLPKLVYYYGAGLAVLRSWQLGRAAGDRLAPHVSGEPDAAAR
ncbi:MAG: SpvB/TcaC N-terminal domain-containing protein [Frankiaceae bacterium]